MKHIALSMAFGVIAIGPGLAGRLLVARPSANL